MCCDAAKVTPSEIARPPSHDRRRELRRHELITGVGASRSASFDAMQCLWLTLADPEPATNGQLIYSKGLVEALSRTGASLRVIGLARPEHSRSPGDTDENPVGARLGDIKTSRRSRLASDVV